jgi:riboflavin synthase
VRGGASGVFTGLIADLGTVAAVDLDGAGARINVRTALASELREGDSIAVSGVCLTAAEVAEEAFSADVMAETLARSSLAELAAGARVNLELPLRAGDRLGGHVVQGHVDGTGSVRETAEQGFARVVWIEIEPALARYLAEKGSVAVDGVSLTVSALDESGFAVSLIPETLRSTSLGALAPGDRVNIEVDIMAKQLERLLEAQRPAAAESGRA